MINDERLCKQCLSEATIWNEILDRSAAEIQANAEDILEPVMSAEQQEVEIKKMVANTKEGILKDFPVEDNAQIVVKTEIDAKLVEARSSAIIPAKFDEAGKLLKEAATVEEARQANNMLKPVFVGVDVSVGNEAKIVLRAGKYYVQRMDGTTRLVTTDLASAAKFFNDMEK